MDLRPALWDGGVGSGQDWGLRYIGDKGGDWGGDYICSRLCEGEGAVVEGGFGVVKGMKRWKGEEGAVWLVGGQWKPEGCGWSFEWEL